MEVYFMALDAISGAIYNDPTKTVLKNKGNLNSPELTATQLKITEIPGVAKALQRNQNDLEKEQNDQRKSDDQIKDAITKANNKMKVHKTKCEFSYHEETKRVSIKVMDKDTEEVIREIPPEETLEMVERMWELAGLLIDEKR
jgi:flagellar protein FlaG